MLGYCIKVFIKMPDNMDYSPDDRIMELEKLISGLQEKNYFLEKQNQELRDEKEKYQLISDFTNDWEFWINPKGEFKWISPSCHDLTGYSADEFLNDPGLFFSIIYPEDENRFKSFFRSAINFTQIGQSIEFRILTRTKQLCWCELNTKAMFDRMGSYLGQRGSIRDITRLMSALGQIKEMSGKQIWEIKAKEKYREEIAGKDRELVSSLIRIAQKNEILLYLRKNLSVIRNTLSLSTQKKASEMLTRIDEHQRRQVFNWEDFILHFEKVYPGFFIRLKGKYPNLTARDQRICAYIRLGLSTKEIAGLINITPESAEIGRVRLRKKLQLNREINLVSFLQEL
jgi:PAS domain S-box-containing protein